MTEKQPRKVLIGTPAHDGRADVWFINSLVNTVKLCMVNNIHVQPIFMSYDSLVQRARNDLVRLAIDEDFDDLIFIDSDEEWDPQGFLELLKHDVDVVGFPVVKKSDTPAFNVKALKSGIKIDENGLMEVEAVGTGFIRLTKKAMKALWDVSPEYTNEGRKCRMIFDVQLVDGELVSEDNVMCRKWASLGNKVWIDPRMTCNHIGPKKFQGNFLSFLESITNEPRE